MNCSQTEPFITMCVDGELDPANEEALTRHMEECPYCRREFEEERQVKRLISERIQRVQAPVQLSEQIRTQLKTVSNRVSLWQRLGEVVEWYPRQIALALAAMLLVTLVSAGFYIRSQSPPSLAIELVKYHFFCPVETTSNRPDDLKAWSEERVNFTIEAPLLSRFNYELLGAHVCEMLHQPALYMVYTGKGTAISFCEFEGLPINFDTLSRIEIKNAQFYTAEYDDKSLVFWKDGDRTCAFIGPVAQDDLLAMAVETRKL